MGNRLLIVLPIVYLFYAVLTLDTSARVRDAPAYEQTAAAMGRIEAELRDNVADEGAEITVSAPAEAWQSLLYYPESMAFRLRTARWSRNFQFWGGIAFAGAVFCVGLSKRGWTKTPPRRLEADEDVDLTTGR